MRWNRLIAGGGPAVIAAAISVAVYDRLPEMLPIHWDAHGVADGFAPKALALSLFPLTALFTGAIMSWAMEKATKPLYADLSTASTGAFLLLMHGQLVWAGTHPPHGLNTGLLMSAIGVLTGVIGFVMPHLSQNRWAGVKTPWTLADEVNWKVTHRFAARSMVAGGVVAALAGLLLPGALGFWIGFTGVMVGGLLPVPYSYLIHRMRR